MISNTGSAAPSAGNGCDDDGSVFKRRIKEWDLERLWQGSRRIAFNASQLATEYVKQERRRSLSKNSGEVMRVSGHAKTVSNTFQTDARATTIYGVVDPSRNEEQFQLWDLIR
jgi:hypothetical protein